MPPEETQAGTGAPSGQQGQQPPSGAPQAPFQQQPQQPTQTPAANAPTTPQGTQAASEPETIANPEAKKYADEAAKTRTELKAAQKRLAELETAEQKRKDAELTDLQRAQKAAQDAEAKLADLTRASRERIIRAEVRVQAASVGIKPELAARLVDTAAIPAEADDDEMATAIGKLLAKLAKDNPELVTKPNGNANNGGQNGGQNGGAASGGTPNPGPTAPERQNGPVTVTANQYMDKTFQQEFKNRYGMSVQDAVLRGKATLI